MFPSQEQGPKHGGVFVIPALGKAGRPLAHWPASTAYWSSRPGKDTVSKDQRERIGETAQGLGVKTVLAEIPNLVPSTHISSQAPLTPA